MRGLEAHGHSTRRTCEKRNYAVHICTRAHYHCHVRAAIKKEADSGELGLSKRNDGKGWGVDAYIPIGTA